MKYKIVRRDFKFNKDLKWFVDVFDDYGTAIASHGYKTKKEAREAFKLNWKEIK